MGLFDKIKPEARKTFSLRRRDCTTYEDAYEYFKYNVDQWKKYENPEELPIFSKVSDGKGNMVVEKDPDTGEVFLELSLHQMPLYWSVQEQAGEKSIKKWDAGKGELVEVRKQKNIKGLSRARVKSVEAGWELIQDLAANEDQDFKQVLSFSIF